MAHYHADDANDAIAAVIEERMPDKLPGWFISIPAKGLNLADYPAWMDFLGEIIRRYRQLVPPCTCPDAGTFAGFQSKRMFELRNAIAEATQCA